MINKVTKDAIDPASKEPEFKICAVQVKRAGVQESGFGRPSWRTGAI